MTELNRWLERKIEEDWKDVENVLAYYEVAPCVSILEEAWQRKAERYSDIFQYGITRIAVDVPEVIEVPWSRSTLLWAFYEAAVSFGLGRIYDRIVHLSGPFTNEEIVYNRTRDGQKLLRLVLKDVPEDERANVELVWSKAIRTFRRSACTLVWSISPLDILLQSMAGITSCHNLEDGCHKGGSVAYMTDEATSIIYTASNLRSFRDLNGLRVPEKNWRTLCFYEPGVGIRLQREYPNETPDYLRASEKLVLERTEDWRLRGVIPKVVYESVAPYRDPAIVGHSMTSTSTIHGIANGVCPECGGIMDSEKNLACPECMVTLYCEECHRTIQSHETYHEVESRVYCIDCYERVFVKCYNCGEEVREERAHFVNGHAYCNNCSYELFTACWKCGELIPKEEIIEVYMGIPYCPNCTIKCAECGREVPAGETYMWHHNPHERFCGDCLERLADEYRRQLAH